MREWLEGIGWNLQLALAGFWGGVVYALRPDMRKAGAIQFFSLVVTGTVAANYLGAVAVKYTGFPELPTGFVVGYCGMLIMNGMFTAVQAIRFFPNKGGGNDEQRP